MLKFIIITALVAYSCADGEDADIEVEEGVLVGTSDNFNSIINNNEFVLAEFYAPWCGHCKKLTPEYAKAAQQLADEESPIKLVKIDATVHTDLGGKFGVRGYPTLKWFRDGVASDYGGGRSQETIVSWVKKKSGPPAVTLASKEDAEKLLKEKVAVIGFFSNVESDDAKAFLKAAASIDDLMFGICSDADLMKEYSMEDGGVSVFKQFDDGRQDKTEDLTSKSITQFVAAASKPLLTEFSQEAAAKLFSDKNTPFLFLAMSKTADAEAYEAAADAVRGVAKEQAGKIVAVYLNTDDKTASQVLNYLDLKDGDYPTYRILNLDKGLKYKPDSSDMSAEMIGAFVNVFLEGDLKPFLKSQDVPADWDSQPVKVLTGKNFVDVAMNKDKHVFVEFYAPWCGHCKKLTPIWDELAEKYEAAENVIIAKMDSTLNEVEEVSVRGFPTLKFFPAGSDEIVDYSGDRSLEDLTKFLSKYAEVPSSNKTDDVEEPVVPEEPAKEEKKKDEL